MISVTILTLNAQRHLNRVLEALKNFDDIVVLDSGSTDSTEAIAHSFKNVRFFYEPFQGFGKAHNLASSLAKHDWILSIDADEVLSSELAQEILAHRLSENCIYEFKFKNIFRNRWIKWCGWHPESHIRLYHRLQTAFTDAEVHEGIMKKSLKVCSFKNYIEHYSYDNLSDFLIKMERYTTLFARQYQGKRKSSVPIALYHGIGAFLVTYFLRRGFLGGYEGFIISTYNAHTAFYKYLKLYELNAVTHFNVSQDRKRETCQLPGNI